MNNVCEHTTKRQLASAEELARHRLAQKVHRATHDGDALIHSLMEFINGDIPDAKACHIHSANVELAVMGGYLPQDYPGAASRVHPAATAAAVATAQGDHDEQPRRKPRKPKVTLKQILNKPIGASIREDTEEGGLLIDFLAQMVNPPPNPDIFSKEEVLPTDRLTAAKELLRRGYGSPNPYYYTSSSAAEEKALNTKFADISRAAYDGMGLTTFLLEEVVRNPRRDRFGEPLKHTYSFSQRIWAAKYLLWRAFDIPWEHITPEAIDAYFRAKYANELADPRRRAQDAAERKEAAKLTAEQKANVMAMFEQLQRETDEADAKSAADAAQKAKKAEKKAAKKARAAQDAASNKKDADNKNAASDKNADTDATKSDNTDAASATNSADRGETAVANALARHPNVDLDTALANHHATAGIPKQNLTHAQIYDAITAEANFQKRQTIIQNRLRAKNPNNAPDDSAPPKSRSP